MGIITFLLVLSVLVFIHELGHFSVARYFGVKVYVFSIGFGPRLYTKEMWGTQWSISAIPLGGYVKMKGQEDIDPTKASMDSDSYNVLTPFKRILILLAGPFANFLLAFVLYFAIALMGHQTLGTTIGKVVKDSPAMNAGILKDDKILQINQTKIKSWNDLSKVIKSSDSTMKFVVQRNNQIRVLTVRAKLTDTKNIFKEDVKRMMVGISPAPIAVNMTYDLFSGLTFAYDKTIESSKMIFQSVQKMIQGIVPSSEVGGVITIGKVISDASENGIVALFLIAALISVNLGVLNLLPIPALDGGHIMFNLYEMITRRKPSEKVLIVLTIAGWAILLGLMGLGLYNDINRLF
ncbi:MAG TPA: RIP metalloprotease RseP [Arcobacter sp.]|nr:RIP metalloprotease RseP [Arcobacter sp.]